MKWCSEYDCPLSDSKSLKDQIATPQPIIAISRSSCGVVADRSPLKDRRRPASRLATTIGSSQGIEQKPTSVVIISVASYPTSHLQCRRDSDCSRTDVSYPSSVYRSSALDSPVPAFRNTFVKHRAEALTLSHATPHSHICACRQRIW